MKNIAIAIALCFAPVAAHAEALSPAQEEAKADFDERTEDALALLNESCGAKVTIKSDFQNFKPDDWARGIKPPALCNLVLAAASSMCKQRPVYKKALGKQLTSVGCVFAGVQPKQKKDVTNTFTLRNLSFTNGALTLRMHTDVVNVGDNTKATVEKALK